MLGGILLTGAMPWPCSPEQPPCSRQPLQLLPLCSLRVHALLQNQSQHKPMAAAFCSAGLEGFNFSSNEMKPSHSLQFFCKALLL